MPFVDVRDLNMYYELQGEGPRLLFVSGSNGDLRRKPNIFDSPVASQFEILAYDQRGLGQTTKLPHEQQIFHKLDFRETAQLVKHFGSHKNCLIAIGEASAPDAPSVAPFDPSIRPLRSIDFLAKTSP